MNDISDMMTWDVTYNIVMEPEFLAWGAPIDTNPFAWNQFDLV